MGLYIGDKSRDIYEQVDFFKNAIWYNISMQITNGGGQMTLFMHYDLNKIVGKDHELRRIDETVSFRKISHDYHDLIRDTGRKGYGVETGIRCVFLQFYYDFSDRQMEEQLRYNIAYRWFVGIGMDEETPDHTYFCRIRKYLGTKRIGKIFNKINRIAEEKKIVRKVFTFVDSRAIVSKETTWAERDKAISEGEEKLNNTNISRYSADKDARFGCKGKNKFWYGYKEHVGVDMGSGLINKVAVTPANVTDHWGLEYICPWDSIIFGDKQYCVSQAVTIMKAHGCESAAILKNNMKGKNRDRDRWISKVRSPFEGTFSKLKRRARYRGLAKVQLQTFMEAIVFNVKRLVTIGAPPLFVGA